MLALTRLSRMMHMTSKNRSLLEQNQSNYVQRQRRRSAFFVKKNAASRIFSGYTCSGFALAAAFLLAFLSTHFAGAQNVSVLTWHNDNSRDGLNANETILKPSNVTSSTFGLVGFDSTDGKVDAQPLVVAGVNIGGNLVSVLYVVTEHDSVYAFNAATGATLWHVSLLKSGETSSDNHKCSQITPEIGITATPVIDRSMGANGAIYIVNMSEDSSGLYHHRINALDLTTGAQLFGGPTTIQATYPGTGEGSTGGIVTFAPGQYAERSALLEFNGDIYTAWTSHCDGPPYTGWVIGYSASTLQQTSVLDVTPNGSKGAIWMSGAGPAATPTRIFLLDANGTFDSDVDAQGLPPLRDFGNAFLQLDVASSGKLQVVDYYATDTTVQQSGKDIDLGSGGTLLLPALKNSSGVEYHLAVGAGKDTNIYLVNRENMGKYHPNGGYIYQVLTGALPNGAWSSPAYFNGSLYYAGPEDYIRQFTIADAQLVSTPASRTPITFPYPGANPSISANGTKDHLLWAVSQGTTSVLRAYNADDLTNEYYDSSQAGKRDQFGAAAHFVAPTIANGYVYVGTTTGVAVFGLLNP